MNSPHESVTTDATRKHLILNAFDMNTVGHLAHGLWAHPQDHARDYLQPGYWRDLARTLETHLFDGLFLADASGVYDVYGGNADAAINAAVQIPVNDPLLPVAIMAADTQHLGFGVTVQTGLEPPYQLARRFSTLDHLSAGRIGWNIVTGFLDSAARSAGQHAAIEHDERYARAEDYLKGTYALWEKSWDDDAVFPRGSQHRYADAAKVRRIDHQGPYYPFQAVHLSEPSPQRTPLLFQAGASARGIDFAARHAECIFLPNASALASRDHIDTVTTRLANAGRARDDVRFLTSVQVIVGATEKEAKDRYEDYLHYAQPHAALVQLASATGIDFSQYDPDEPLVLAKGNGIHSAIVSLQRQSTGDAPLTVNRLLTTMPLGGRFTPVVGSGETVARQLIAYADATGIDGFNLVRTVTPGCFDDMGVHLIPVLQRLGRFKTRYANGTFREKLFGAGRSRLPANHIAHEPTVPS